MGLFLICFLIRRGCILVASLSFLLGCSFLILILLFLAFNRLFTLHLLFFLAVGQHLLRITVCLVRRMFGYAIDTVGVAGAACAILTHGCPTAEATACVREVTVGLRVTRKLVERLVASIGLLLLV